MCFLNPYFAYVLLINIEFTGCTTALLKSVEAAQSHRFHVVTVFGDVLAVSCCGEVNEIRTKSIAVSIMCQLESLVRIGKY